MTVDTLKLIVKAFPDGLIAQDTHGNTPLHYAFLWFEGTTEEKRSYLIQANPVAAAIQSSKGSFPLHYCAEYGTATPWILWSLSDANPSAIVHRNAAGKVPLELAIAKKTPPFDARAATAGSDRPR